MRLVSFVHRSVAAVRYEVKPLDGETRIVVQSEIVANEDVPARSEDPRAAAILARAARLGVPRHPRAARRARAPHARERPADGGRDGPRGRRAAGHGHRERELRRPRARDRERRGRPRRDADADQVLAYGWSSQRSMVSIRDQVDAALASARRTGFDGLLDDQRDYLDDFWKRADVEIDGDDELQQAVRFALFHTLQSAARAEKRAIAAKGLTGDGYDGHVFWDTESFVLPVLTYTAPDGSPRCALLAPLDARPRHRARAAAAPRGRRVPVADDPRPRVLGLLAGRHGRLPRQRRHRRRRAALPQRDRRRRVRARGGARAAGGDRAAVALAGPPRRARRVPHRRGHGARRVLGRRGRQRLHEPHGRPEPGRGGGGIVRATARRRRRSGSTTRRSPRGATRRARSPCPTTTSSRSTSSRRATRATSAGTSRRPRPTSTRCCCTSPTSTSIASRSSSRPTSCSRCSPSAIASRRARRRAPSRTTSR